MIVDFKITDELYEKLTEMLRKHPKILNSTDFLKINRSISYMTFIVKELCDFITAKTNDGLPIYKLREIKNHMREVRGKIGVFKSYLR